MSADYLEPYRKSAARHGAQSYRVTNWASPRAQRRRFAVVAAMARLRGRRVLDAGCSRGDFAAYLLERGVAFSSYTGVDALPSVIEFARGRGLARCAFACGDLLKDPALLRLGEPEVVCISGTLNTMADGQVFGLLEEAWASASAALVFNFLSDRAGSAAPPQWGAVRRLDTMALLDWAFERTPQVRFRQDYFRHGHDATIAMFRPHP